jgi:hypothetical protein
MQMTEVRKRMTEDWEFGSGNAELVGSQNSRRKWTFLGLCLSV